MSTPEPAPDTPQGPTQGTDAQAAAVASSQQTGQLRDLATVLHPDSGGPYAVVTKGVVTGRTIPGTPPVISVELSGDTSTSVDGVRFVNSYSPTVGDTVLLARQGSDVFALGKMADGGAHAASGWTEPSLNSGFTRFDFDPAMYRMVIDHGSNMIQLRGRVNIGSPGSWSMWTMPAEMVPLFNLAPILIARNPAGSNVAQLLVGADGTMIIDGRNVGVTGVTSSGGGTTGASSSGSTGSTDVNHKHRSSDHPSSPTAQVFTDHWTDWIVTGSVSHSHSMSHTHSTPNHTHTMTTVANPTFVSLNGISYYI